MSKRFLLTVICVLPFIGAGLQGLGKPLVLGAVLDVLYNGVRPELFHSSLHSLQLSTHHKYCWRIKGDYR